MSLVFVAKHAKCQLEHSADICNSVFSAMGRKFYGND